MATSWPWAAGGREPKPAEWTSQSSKAKGKSGPNMVTGLCVDALFEAFKESCGLQVKPFILQHIPIQ
jgi:hypothetical protein